MLPTTRGWYRMLRLGLLFSAIGWGISFAFTFASWEASADQLQAMGADRIAYQPLLDYWLKMASSAFGCIGVACGLAALRPAAHVGMIRLLAPFHFVIGTTLALAAARNHLTPKLHPTFLADISFCFIAAILIGLPLIQAWRADGRDQPH